MLAKRIIAVLTFENGELTRTKNFIADYKYTKKFINNSLFDGIVLIDISKSNKKRYLFYEVVKNFAKSCFVPICVGGKINTINEVRKFQELGADKILINSSAVKNKKFVKKLINMFGSQFVVIGLDLKFKKNMYKCYFNRGKSLINQTLDNYLKEINNISPGEILIQSIDRDGTFKGFDLKILKEIKRKSSCPLIVCGGAGKWQDFVDAFKKSNVDAVCTNNIFHLTYQSILNAKEYCKKKSIEVRLEK